MRRQKDWRGRVKSMTSFKHPLVRSFLAEFVATFTVMTIGIGSSAQQTLMGTNNNLIVYFAWCLGIAMAIWMAGSITGGHLNPAFSFAMAVLGRLHWLDCFVYTVAQYLGAFTAGAAVFGIFYEKLDDLEGGVRNLATAAIWSSYPAACSSWYSSLLSSIFGTAFMMMLIFPLFDPNNRKVTPPSGIQPFIFGLAIFSLILAYGETMASTINPARDLGPRTFTFVAGWGAEVFSVRNYNWFWIPIVGPYIGGVLGTCLYHFFIGNQLERIDDIADKDLADVKLANGTKPGQNKENSRI